MAILAIVTTITMPALAKPLEDAKLQADARRMAAVLRMVRQESITTGKPRTVVFYTSSAKYKVMGQTTYYFKSGIDFVGNTTFTMRSDSLPACSFSPSGAPSSGGTVTLSNRYSRLYIIVNPVAGRIRISENPPANW